MTDAESKLWRLIRRKQMGVSFYRQKPLGKYIADFYCPKAELVIEIDGGQHWEVHQQENDRVRDAALAKQGLHVIRLANNDVLTHMEGVYTVIKEYIDKKIPPAFGEARQGRLGPPLQKGGTINPSMKAQVCVPITAGTVAKALAAVKKAVELGADFVEFRLDYLEDISSHTIPELLADCPVPSIMTARSAAEGGKWDLTESERFVFLRQAVECGAPFVDVELRSDAVLRDELIARKGASRIIVSYHDFLITPDIGILWGIFEEELSVGADVGKIATMALSDADVQKIRELLSRVHQARKDCIALCMGDKGTASRINSPAWGSYLTFAALEKGLGSAPGQLTISDLRLIWQKSRMYNPQV